MSVVAPYRVTPVEDAVRTIHKAVRDKDTNHFNFVPVEETVTMYMVQLPGGRSVRVDKQELTRLGLQYKPVVKPDQKEDDDTELPERGELYEFAQDWDTPTANGRNKK